MPLTGQAKTIYQRYYMRRRRQSGLDPDYKAKRCASCGSTEIIDRHHIDRDHNNNEIDNLVDLCPNCHALIHRGRKVHKWLASPLIANQTKLDLPVRPSGTTDADGNIIYD